MSAVGGSDRLGDNTEDGSGLDMLEELLICYVFQVENKFISWIEFTINLVENTCLMWLYLPI